MGARRKGRVVGNDVKDRISELIQGQESFITALRSDDPAEREKALNTLLLRIARCLESVGSSMSELCASVNHNHERITALEKHGTGEVVSWAAWCQQRGTMLVVSAAVILVAAIMFDSPIADAVAEAIRRWTTRG